MQISYPSKANILSGTNDHEIAKRDISSDIESIYQLFLSGLKALGQIPRNIFNNILELICKFVSMGRYLYLPHDQILISFFHEF